MGPGPFRLCRCHPRPACRRSGVNNAGLCVPSQSPTRCNPVPVLGSRFTGRCKSSTGSSGHGVARHVQHEAANLTPNPTHLRDQITILQASPSSPPDPKILKNMRTGHGEFDREPRGESIIRSTPLVESTGHRVAHVPRPKRPQSAEIAAPRCVFSLQLFSRLVAAQRRWSNLTSSAAA